MGGRKGERVEGHTCMGGNKLLEVTYCVVWVALDPDLLAKAVIAHNLNHEKAGRGAERRGGASTRA